MTLDEWLQMLEPLMIAHPWTYLFFMLFIGIAALVVESSVKRTQCDDDYVKEIFDRDVECIKDEYADILLVLDCNGDGVIDKVEFVSAAMQIPSLEQLIRSLSMDNSPEELETVFELFDQDGSGELDV